MRRINGVWYNLNSTNKQPGPQLIKDGMLDIFLASITQEGFTVWTLRGDALP